MTTTLDPVDDHVDTRQDGTGSSSGADSTDRSSSRGGDSTDSGGSGDGLELRADGQVDGRAARGRRTREAVIEALLALQEEGDLTPTAARVAARAGVALRTVYGHFADMEALWLEAGKRELGKISALADVPPPDAPQQERLERFCASRARVLEALLPVMRATRLRLPTSPQLTRNWATFVAVGKAEVRDVFAAELAGLEPEAADRLAAGIYLASSGPAWEFLRLDLHLGVEACAAVVRDGVAALLAARETVATPPRPEGRPEGGPA